ncbi:hypothetical protein U9M48_041065 [Paspalum notatum var. saurae]|uniref:Uncharacterized protein n=1 Tax=Paspalum notatum var. saurae TaxID=547442 RepID=A0AAQ3UN56_PASNO
MVQQRASSRRECRCASSSGDGIVMATGSRRRRRRDAAIVAIKTQMLRCCSRGDKLAGQRRFKRPYYAAGERADSAAVLYLACLVSMYDRAAASSRLVPGVDERAS